MITVPWCLQPSEFIQLSQPILDNMPVIFRRLSDEEVEDSCFDLIIFLLSGTDPHLKVSGRCVSRQYFG